MYHYLTVYFKLYINEVVLGTAFGILMGPHCANIFNPRSWNENTNTITLEVMRVVLATGLFAIGVELPKSYLADHAKGLLVMVVPTMAFGWLIVAGTFVAVYTKHLAYRSSLAIVYVIFPPLNFISSLAIAACLTPTDPIICAAIVGKPLSGSSMTAPDKSIEQVESMLSNMFLRTFDALSLLSPPPMMVSHIRF